MTLKDALDHDDFDVTQLSRGTLEEAPEEVRAKLQEYQDRVSWLRENPEEHAQERIASINDSLEDIEPRPTTHEDNICMCEHLENVKARIERDPEAEAQKRIGKIQQRAQSRIQRLVDGEEVVA